LITSTAADTSEEHEEGEKKCRCTALFIDIGTVQAIEATKHEYCRYEKRADGVLAVHGIRIEGDYSFGPHLSTIYPLGNKQVGLRRRLYLIGLIRYIPQFPAAPFEGS
jgi:hypothetical protein